MSHLAVPLHDVPYDGHDSLPLTSASEFDGFDNLDSAGSKQGAPALQPCMLRASGPWPRDEFAHHVLALSDRSEDEALAYIMNSFPSVGLGRAKLWLIYMKDANIKGAPFNAYIMDSFRQVDWYQVVLSDTAAELVPELHCLLPRLFVEASVFDVESATQMSTLQQLGETVPSGCRSPVEIAPPSVNFSMMDKALEGLYIQTQEVMMAWSRLAREIITLKDQTAAMVRSLVSIR